MYSYNRYVIYNANKIRPGIYLTCNLKYRLYNAANTANITVKVTELLSKINKNK